MCGVKAVFDLGYCRCFFIIILVVLFGFKQYNWTSTFHRTFLAFAFVFILKFNVYSII